MIGKIFILGCFLALPAFSLFAQPVIAENKQIIETNAAAYFNKAIGEQSFFYNGKAYDFYSLKLAGSAYFNDARSFEKGYVKYNGAEFENVQLMYDLNKDLVISLRADGFTKFSLESEKLAEFKLFDHSFLRIAADSANKKIIASGFYDLVYNGKLKVLVKRSKSIQTNTDNHTLTEYFKYRNNYFLQSEGRYYHIDSESAFLSVFRSYRNELRKQLRSAGIKYKNDPEKAAILLATYYDNLTN